MLAIEYEQSLIETTVFLAVRDDAQLESELHLLVDRLYEIPDEELRHREFVPVFRGFFTKLGFDRLISELLAERSLIGDHVDQCVVREAARRKAESAELLIRGDEDHSQKTLVIQFCPQSFIDAERIIPLLRRELLHVSDMLDERFGYEREGFTGDPSRQNLQRDRYHVLWNVYVEGRLEREGSSDHREKARHRQAFDRAFRTAQKNDAAFDRVFDAASVTHRQLMDWACDVTLLFDSKDDLNSDVVSTPCVEAS